MKTERTKKKTSIRLWQDQLDELLKLSHGYLYQSEYQTLLCDILDAALQNKMLVLKVLQKKEDENKANKCLKP